MAGKVASGSAAWKEIVKAAKEFGKLVIEEAAEDLYDITYEAAAGLLKRARRVLGVDRDDTYESPELPRLPAPAPPGRAPVTLRPPVPRAPPAEGRLFQESPRPGWKAPKAPVLPLAARLYAPAPRAPPTLIDVVRCLAASPSGMIVLKSATAALPPQNLN